MKITVYIIRQHDDNQVVHILTIQHLLPCEKYVFLRPTYVFTVLCATAEWPNSMFTFAMQYKNGLLKRRALHNVHLVCERTTNLHLVLRIIKICGIHEVACQQKHNYLFGNQPDSMSLVILHIILTRPKK